MTDLPLNMPENPQGFLSNIPALTAAVLRSVADGEERRVTFYNRCEILRVQRVEKLKGVMDALVVVVAEEDISPALLDVARRVNELLALEIDTQRNDNNLKRGDVMVYEDIGKAFEKGIGK